MPFEERLVSDRLGADVVCETIDADCLRDRSVIDSVRADVVRETIGSDRLRADDIKKLIGERPPWRQCRPRDDRQPTVSPPMLP